MTNFIEKEPSLPSLRRFLARKLDYTIAVVLYICFIGAIYLSILFIKPKFMADIEAHIAWLLLPILSIFLFIPIILSLIMYYFGNSFGKALLGLKVLFAYNTQLTLSKLLKREFLVLFLGTGFFIYL